MGHLNKTILTDEVRWLLEAITEQFEAINAYEDKIPQIEFDIIMENIRKLYENLYRLNRLSDPYHPAEKPVAASQEVRQPEPVSPEPAENKVLEKEPPVQPAVRIRVETTEPEHRKKESRRAASDTAEIDLFSGGGTSFPEKLKEAREKNMAAERHSTGKKDLKAAISINEKFLFINELFDGNLREYNITIETLNGFADLRQAFEYLDLERMKNLWESESPAFRRLKELVEQKF